MFLLKCDKNGELNNIKESDVYTHLLKLLTEIKEELENNDIFLINEEITNGKNKIYEFASVEGGWECAYFIVDKMATKIKIINQNKDE